MKPRLSSNSVRTAVVRLFVLLANNSKASSSIRKFLKNGQKAISKNYFSKGKFEKFPKKGEKVNVFEGLSF